MAETTNNITAPDGRTIDEQVGVVLDRSRALYVQLLEEAAAKLREMIIDTAGMAADHPDGDGHLEHLQTLARALGNVEEVADALDVLPDYETFVRDHADLARVQQEARS